MSTEDIKSAHALLTYQDKYTKFEGLPINGTKRYERNLISWSHELGWCEGEDFELHGLTYKDSYLAGQYEFILKDGLATVDLDNDLIKLFGGTTCIYSIGRCEDMIYGTIIWDSASIDLSNCDMKRYAVLYDGPALISTYPPTQTTPAREIVSVKREVIGFSLVLIRQALLCSQHGYISEHPKLFIIKINHNMRFFR